MRRVLQVHLLRRAKDIRFVRVRHRRVDSRVPERLRIFVRQPRLDKRVPAGRDPACHCVPEADLLEDILSVPVAPANEAAGRIKDLLADNVPVRPAEREFRKLSPASRFTRGSHLRVAARLSKNAMRKANASFILCVRARAQAPEGRRRLSLSRRCNANRGK